MNHNKLPSISNLLIHNTPILNLSPASPKVIYNGIAPTTPPYSNKSPRLLSVDQNTPSNIISPIPSPMSTYINEKSLPPIHGDDPPQQLRRLPLNTSSTNTTQPSLSSQPNYYNSISTDTTTTNHNSLINKYHTNRLHYSHPHEYLNYHVASNNSINPLKYNCTTNQTHPVTQSLSPPPALPPSPLVFDKRKRSSTVSTTSSLNDEPSTKIILDDEGQPVLKRKRGRPPTTISDDQSSWTFLTPTVWDIPISKDQKERETNAKSSTTDQMNDSMTTAFTSSSMETVFYMPRKKRGRKPKHFINGNSCFIWKDLTSTRSKQS